MKILASPAFSNEKINPYNSLLYREITGLGSEVSEYSHSKAIFKKFDVIHFHWPDGYINKKSVLKAWQRITVFIAVLISAKLKGSKIVWTVHNVVPHDAFHPKLSKHFMGWFISQCDGLIFMSEEGRQAFFNLYGSDQNLKYQIIPHGHYRNSYPASIDRNEARKLLNLKFDKKIILSLGMIKPYKNIDGLIKTFNIGEFNNYELVVAGKPETPELSDELKRLSQNAENVSLFLKFIPDDEVNIYLSAADILILPYNAILNSGALLLALSFNKPVIAPHMGAIIALQKELGQEWIYSFKGELNSNSLLEALTFFESTYRSDICPLDNYNWDRLAQSTLAFYTTLTQ